MSLFWDEQLTGTGTSTLLPLERSIAMQVSASGDKVIRQTKEYYVYRAGQSQLILTTFVMSDPDPNVVEEIGYFDSENGLFLRRNGANVSFVIRRNATPSVVDRVFLQADWNIDRLDGTGASGITLDLTKAQILVIDFQWLGVGRVRFGFDLNGDIVYAHQVFNANTTLTQVYMQTGQLPIRYQIEATGIPAAPSTLKQICSAVIREGGENEPSVSHQARTGKNPITVGTDYSSVIGIRLKSDKIRACVRLSNALVLNEDDNVSVEYMVVLNPTITAGTPVWIDVDGNADSVIEMTRTELTITVDAAGDPIGAHAFPLGGFVGSGGKDVQNIQTAEVSETAVPIAANIDGVSDVAYVICRSFSGTVNVRAIITWIEEL